MNLHMKRIRMQTQEGGVALSWISTHRYFSPPSGLHHYVCTYSSFDHFSLSYVTIVPDPRLKLQSVDVDCFKSVSTPVCPMVPKTADAGLLCDILLSCYLSSKNKNMALSVPLPPPHTFWVRADSVPWRRRLPTWGRKGVDDVFPNSLY